jgi:GTP-binding protein LepA
MDLERERGITIKAHPIRMEYRSDSGASYIFHLIDTPGHIDFSYEVSRSLAACEGAILVVDATQGIEAQTLTNIYLALENDLAIVPVINKIDLPSAHPEDVAKNVSDLLGIPTDDILFCSAKSGLGVREILERVITVIPPPRDLPDVPLRALVFDSLFDSFRGAVAYIRVFDGVIRQGDKITFLSNGRESEANELGFFIMGRVVQKELHAGEVGYLIANIKTLSDIKIGDTVTGSLNPTADAIPGYKEVKPMVFSGLYPIDKGDYDDLRSALEKLKLNDDSISYVPETSTALGFGFRAGFLGLLHMEVIQERLLREHNVNIITTLPNVKYKVLLKNGDEIFIDCPAKLPQPNDMESISEPIAKVQIITPTEYVGSIMKLSEDHRGKMVSMEYLETTRVHLTYSIPLSELIVDYFDSLKGCSRGYASMDYEFEGYREEALIKLEIMINGDPVDAFSIIIHRDKAFACGQEITSLLKDLIPRQMYAVAIQASINNRVVARTNVKPFRKDVTSKCYGGDISRKRKLLEKQKEGKKRMKQIGNVEIPQEAFLAVLSRK